MKKVDKKEVNEILKAFRYSPVLIRRMAGATVFSTQYTENDIRNAQTILQSAERIVRNKHKYTR